ncbi:hypothetical protein EVAR_55899_1 [Eumeta japonica]|uniref:Uncharacterized protein n=1 Tax=Eumeta variegata TaxID=151549 RepID=A0A4C1YM68_EUMVA|nr:hypothetical protein EVAR_55899_1 [Eumeta japonica]
MNRLRLRIIFSSSSSRDGTLTIFGCVYLLAKEKLANHYIVDITSPARTARNSSTAPPNPRATHSRGRESRYGFLKTKRSCAGGQGFSEQCLNPINNDGPFVSLDISAISPK